MVCRCCGVSRTIRSTSGRKPRSSILSASSSTSARTELRSRWRRSARSSSRPGVPSNNVHAGGQRVDLRFIGAAAVDGQHFRPQVDRGDAQVVGDLDRQFPGGHDHEGLRVRLCPCSSISCSSGTPNARVFPVPVLRLPDDVLPGQCQRQGKRLNGESGEDARGLEARADRLADAEVTERDGVGLVRQGRKSRQGIGRCGRCLGLVPAKSLSCQGFHPSSWPCPAVPGSGPSSVPRLPAVSRPRASCDLVRPPRHLSDAAGPGSPLPSFGTLPCFSGSPQGGPDMAT